MKKLKLEQSETSDEICRCESQDMTCPVEGKCTTENVVYEAQVKVKNTIKSYIGMTSRPFIERWKEHRGNIRYKHQKGTKLSSFVWNQKKFGENIEIDDIKFKLKAKTSTYKPGAKFCGTCLSEKTYIALCNPKHTLNSRTEIVSKCIHRKYFKLKYLKPPKKPLNITPKQGDFEQFF